MRDGCSKNGRLIFEGVEHFLPSLEPEDIKIIDIQLKVDREILEEILRRDDLKDMDEIQMSWREDVKSLIRIRKRQITAIAVEFLRRKKLERPLEKFAFPAVHELLGQEMLDQVKQKAKEMQEKHKEEVKALPNKSQWIPSTLPSAEGTMCGEKVRHRDSREANEHIESMKANGKNTRGIVTYGPCPFCGFYHVGHKPKGALWSRADLKIAE